MLKMKIKNGMTTITKSLFYVSCFSLLVLLMPSCTKDTSNGKGKAHLSVMMTDAPANYDAVMVDVVGIEVIDSDNFAKVLTPKTGVYNLLNLSNGIDTLIATGDVEPGTISQIRLILGPNNSVTVGGVVYPLSTPSAEQSGLKLQVHQTFEPDISYSILLDFDASQSIVMTGNGEYKLNPVIRTIDMAITGAIKGSITPIGANVIVTATADGVSYASVTNSDGEFVISGLPAGTYDILVTPELPLLPFTVIGKAVVIGASTNIGIVAL